MCMRDVLIIMRRDGLPVTESRIRWAISSGKVDRPPLDGSLRFDFGGHHLDQLRRVFAAQVEGGR